MVRQVQVKQVKSSKFKLSNLNQASQVKLDRDTAPRKRPSPSLSGKMGKMYGEAYHLGMFLNIMVSILIGFFPLFSPSTLGFLPLFLETPIWEKRVLGGIVLVFFHPETWGRTQFDEHIFRMGWFNHQPVWETYHLGVLFSGFLYGKSLGIP